MNILLKLAVPVCVGDGSFNGQGSSKKTSKYVLSETGEQNVYLLLINLFIVGRSKDVGLEQLFT